MVRSRDPHIASVLDEDAYRSVESSTSSTPLAGAAGSETSPAMARVLGRALSAISDTRLSIATDVRARHATEVPAVARTNAVDFQMPRPATGSRKTFPFKVRHIFNWAR
ncbi:hypothetical protein MMC22_010773 [Lobaria immixta]|nr:hypothetical protein [Lobaria immixta]